MATLITNMFSYIWIILFYLIFILLEYKFFSKKLDLIISDKDKRKKVFDIIHEIRQDVKSYFLIKTFVSLLTWLFSYMVMKSVWLDFAMFWAFLIFILNFIPNIWSVIAVIFPAVLSLIQFDGHVNFFIVLSWLILIQMIVWNIIDPKLTWNKLNLSPLVILLALVFWWLIWGFVGAILSVPIMVIISIIFSKFEETKPLAILLSEKWVLKSNLDIELTKAEIKTLQKVKNFFVNK
jgi:predicted PurR-regulated permease PerM